MAWLRHLALRCSDLEKSRRFYEYGVGWRFVGWRPSGNSLDLTDGVNNITLLQHPAGSSRKPLEEGDEFIHFSVIVPDVDASWRRFHELGVEFSKESVKDRNAIDPTGAAPASFKVLDPDGNVVDVSGNRDEWRGVWLPSPAAAAATPAS